MNFEIKESEISVSELLQGCMEGNRKSWDLFFDKFHRLITGVVNHKLSENKDDTVQLIYLRLVENDYNILRKFYGNSYGSLLFYIKEVAKNVVREEYKKDIQINKNMDSFKNIDEELVDPQTIPNYDSEKDLNFLLDEIMELEISFREVLALRFLGYKSREIAQILNIPLNTVLTRVKRGIEKIKKK